MMTHRIDGQFKFSRLAVDDQKETAKRQGIPPLRPLNFDVAPLVDLLIKKIRIGIVSEVYPMIKKVQKSGLIDSCGPFGLTPLMWAASWGDRKTSKTAEKKGSVCVCGSQY